MAKAVTIDIGPARLADDRAFVTAFAPHLTAVGDTHIYRRDETAGFLERYIRSAVDEPENSVILIARIGDERAGFIVAQLGANEVTNGLSAHIALLGVMPWAEGRGVAASLMAEAEAWARAHGCGFLTLEVVAGNARAISLYERLGFAHDSVKMARRL